MQMLAGSSITVNFDDDEVGIESVQNPGAIGQQAEKEQKGIL